MAPPQVTTSFQIPGRIGLKIIKIVQICFNLFKLVQNCLYQNEWINQISQISQIHQISQISQINQINQINQISQINQIKPQMLGVRPYMTSDARGGRGSSKIWWYLMRGEGGSSKIWRQMNKNLLFEICKKLAVIRTFPYKDRQIFCPILNNSR